MKLLEKWKESWFYPVLVNLSTALVLFLVMLTFKPVRNWLLPPEAIANYPLISTAEPYLSESKQKLIIDFFIINRTGKEYTREDLEVFLKQNNPNPDISPSPNIRLNYNRLEGRIDSIYVDKKFNDKKGDLTAVIDKDSNSLEISINTIAARALLKVKIIVANIEDLELLPIVRSAKSFIPFDYEKYQDACYSR